MGDTKLVSAIKWKSIEKDNMEFTAKVSCFQKDAVQRLAAINADLLEAAEKFLEDHLNLSNEDELRAAIAKAKGGE